MYQMERSINGEDVGVVGAGGAREAGDMTQRERYEILAVECECGKTHPRGAYSDYDIECDCGRWVKVPTKGDIYIYLKKPEASHG